MKYQKKLKIKQKSNKTTRKTKDKREKMRLKEIFTIAKTQKTQAELK